MRPQQTLGAVLQTSAVVAAFQYVYLLYCANAQEPAQAKNPVV
jgi:hypothetical protein